MHKTATSVLAAAIAFLALPAAATQCSSLAPLEWLIGEWVADSERSTARESWSVIGPGAWAGRGTETSKSDPSRSSSEVLRLVEMADGVYYIAKVAHNELPIAFRLSECDGNRFAFVNPSHDFPRRLEYVRSDEPGHEGHLHAHVSDGADKGFTLDFKRQAMPAQDQDVLAAEDARFAAMIRGDAGALRQALADDLSYVHTTGEVEGRDAFIASIVERRRRYLEVEPLERHVVRDGPGSAFVQGKARLRVAAGEQELDFQARYLAVYVLRDGAWRLRAWQSLRLP